MALWHLFEPGKVGWLDKGTRRLCEGGGKFLKYLKRGGNREEGRGNKDLKKGGRLGHGVGALKRGAGTSLRTMCNWNEI